MRDQEGSSKWLTPEPVPPSSAGRRRGQEALWGDAQRDALQVFEEAERTARHVGIALRLPRAEPPASQRPTGTPGCDWPWRSAYVTYDGKVQPCCMIMGTDRGVLGDLGHDGFGPIWRGDGYVAFRERLLEDDPPDVCRGCSMYRGVF